jgi:hypothetical protein
MSNSRDQRMPEPVCGVGAEGSDTKRSRYLGADGRRDLTLGARSLTSARLWMHVSRLVEPKVTRACEPSLLERDRDHVSMRSVQHRHYMAASEDVRALRAKPFPPMGAANSDHGRQPVAMSAGGSPILITGGNRWR